MDQNFFSVMKTPFEYENVASFLKWASCTVGVLKKQQNLVLAHDCNFGSYQAFS